MNEWDSLVFVVKNLQPETPDAAFALLNAIRRHAGEKIQPPRMSKAMIRTLWDVVQREVASEL